MENIESARKREACMPENRVTRIITDHEHPQAVSLPPAEEIEAAARFLRTLGDPTKLKIVCALAGEDGCEREICAGGIAAALGMTKSAVSHQLKILREEGLVRCRREGKHMIYSLDDDHVSRAVRMTMEHIHHRKEESRHTAEE